MNVYTFFFLIFLVNNLFETSDHPIKLCAQNFEIYKSNFRSVSTIYWLFIRLNMNLTNKSVCEQFCNSMNRLQTNIKTSTSLCLSKFKCFKYFRQATYRYKLLVNMNTSCPMNHYTLMYIYCLFVFIVYLYALYHFVLIKREPQVSLVKYYSLKWSSRYQLNISYLIFD